MKHVQGVGPICTTEMRLVRWNRGKTRKDHMTHENIRRDANTKHSEVDTLPFPSVE